MIHQNEKSTQKILESSFAITAGMGYDINRFQGDVDEELICPICSGVLEEPLQVIELCHQCSNTHRSHKMSSKNLRFSPTGCIEMRPRLINNNCRDY